MHEGSNIDLTAEASGDNWYRPLHPYVVTFRHGDSGESLRCLVDPNTGIATRES